MEFNSGFKGLMTRAHHYFFFVSAYKENYIPGVKASKS